MTTDQALSLVDQVGAATQMNRQDHIAFQGAVATIRVALAAKADGDLDTGEPSRDGAREEVPAE